MSRFDLYQSFKNNNSGVNVSCLYKSKQESISSDLNNLIFSRFGVEKNQTRRVRGGRDNLGWIKIESNTKTLPIQIAINSRNRSDCSIPFHFILIRHRTNWSGKAYNDNASLINQGMAFRRKRDYKWSSSPLVSQ